MKKNYSSLHLLKYCFDRSFLRGRSLSSAFLVPVLLALLLLAVSSLPASAGPDPQVAIESRLADIKLGPINLKALSKLTMNRLDAVTKNGPTASEVENRIIRAGGGSFYDSRYANIRSELATLVPALMALVKRLDNVDKCDLKALRELFNAYDQMGWRFDAVDKGFPVREGRYGYDFIIPAGAVVSEKDWQQLDRDMDFLYDIIVEDWYYLDELLYDYYRNCRKIHLSTGLFTAGVTPTSQKSGDVVGKSSLSITDSTGKSTDSVVVEIPKFDAPPDQQNKIVTPNQPINPKSDYIVEGTCRKPQKVKGHDLLSGNINFVPKPKRFNVTAPSTPGPLMTRDLIKKKYPDLDLDNVNVDVNKVGDNLYEIVVSNWGLKKGKTCDQIETAKDDHWKAALKYAHSFDLGLKIPSDFSGDTVQDRDGNKTKIDNFRIGDSYRFNFGFKPFIGYYGYSGDDENGKKTKTGDYGYGREDDFQFGYDSGFIIRPKYGFSYSGYKTYGVDYFQPYKPKYGFNFQDISPNNGYDWTKISPRISYTYDITGKGDAVRLSPGFGLGYGFSSGGDDPSVDDTPALNFQFDPSKFNFFIQDPIWWKILSRGFPNDPLFHSRGGWGQQYYDQWGLRRIGFRLARRDRSESLWPEKAQPVIVAVIDTGLDQSHPELLGAVWHNKKEIPFNHIDDDKNGYVDDIHGWNFIDNNNDIHDVNGHGTVTAGIIAAWVNNGTGIAGVNPWARIMPIKAMRWDGSGTNFDAAKAIRYAVDNGARVINLSIGGKQIGFAERKAVDYARKKGVILVAAAGNEGDNTKNFSPAGLPGVVTVAATMPDDRRIGYSGWGAGVDIAAPGVDILSVRAKRTDLLKLVKKDYKPGMAFVGDDNRYYRVTGTSFAAPYVSGVASLILSINPKLTDKQVLRKILHSARDIDTPGWDQFTGYGLLDARAALKADPEFYVISRILKVGGTKQGGKFFIEVSGRAKADKFSRAWIEAGAGKNPKEWKKISGDITKPVNMGRLALISPGHFRGAKTWKLRLVVEHKNGFKRVSMYNLNLK